MTESVRPRVGELVVGDLLLSVGAPEGAEARPCPDEWRPAPVRRAEPGWVRSAGVGPVDREADVAQVLGLLAEGRSVRLTGKAGAGRSALLAAVAEAAGELARDGVVSLAGHRRTAADLLQELFAATHQAPGLRPDLHELPALLAGLAAVVAIDDLAPAGEELEGLLAAAPGCVFVVAAEPGSAALPAGSRLTDHAVAGLSRAACLALTAKLARRPLDAAERAWAVDLWFESEGLPLRFVQAAALLRHRDVAVDALVAAQEDRTSVFGLANPVELPEDPAVLEAELRRTVPLPSVAEAAAPARRLAAGLSESAQEVLRLALALGGECPTAPHLPALIGVDHGESALRELAECGLAVPAGGHQRLATGVAAALADWRTPEPAEEPPPGEPGPGAQGESAPGADRQSGGYRLSDGYRTSDEVADAAQRRILGGSTEDAAPHGSYREPGQDAAQRRAFGELTQGVAQDAAQGGSYGELAPAAGRRAAGPVAAGAAQHFSWWVGHASVGIGQVAAEAEVLVGVLLADREAGRWEQVLRLARAAGPALALALRWGAWERTLQLGLEAARELGATADEAWCRHEAGVLALCLRRPERAVADLEAAIALRAAAGETRGVAAARRMLALAVAPEQPAAPSAAPGRRPVIRVMAQVPWRYPGPTRKAVLAGAAAVLALGVLGTAVGLSLAGPAQGGPVPVRPGGTVEPTPGVLGLPGPAALSSSPSAAPSASASATPDDQGEPSDGPGAPTTRRAVPSASETETTADPTGTTQAPQPPAQQPQPTKPPAPKPTRTTPKPTPTTSAPTTPPPPTPDPTPTDSATPTDPGTPTSTPSP
ncbi:hypothetical protein [Kitasatospora sp. MMS16-BH015]|uniref:hypothetical protein n=1 Tax=Kitasatospora sp. MMS16-BH015 TaxID=2018025 RepID=UPI00131A4F1A|nr:hypothetical protein [Kitasatospora sp. MMS16-BH015]